MMQKQLTETKRLVSNHESRCDMNFKTASAFIQMNDQMNNVNSAHEPGTVPPVQQSSVKKFQ